MLPISITTFHEKNEMIVIVRQRLHSYLTHSSMRLLQICCAMISELPLSARVDRYSARSLSTDSQSFKIPSCAH